MNNKTLVYVLSVGRDVATYSVGKGCRAHLENFKVGTVKIMLIKSVNKAPMLVRCLVIYSCVLCFVNTAWHHAVLPVKLHNCDY